MFSWSTTWSSEVFVCKLKRIFWKLTFSFFISYVIQSLVSINTLRNSSFREKKKISVDKFRTPRAPNDIKMAFHFFLNLLLEIYWEENYASFWYISEGQGDRHSREKDHFTYSKSTIEILEKRCEMSSELILKTPERRQWCPMNFIGVPSFLFNNYFMTEVALL